MPRLRANLLAPPKPSARQVIEPYGSYTKPLGIIVKTQLKRRVLAILIITVSALWLTSALRSLFNFYSIYFELQEGKICNPSRAWIFYVNAFIGLLGVGYGYLLVKKKDINWMRYVLAIFLLIAIITKYHI
ncbi:hypothetical protein BST85_13365 [Aureitalea marina]|uniref:Uncharacterized protein n=1 Tax=Aureitalea marina TaxID=930804 RepID=A0A2S7KT23_9FLAO|nr:hypothetical protein BST85_13365 [Aureitalea marina]